MPPHILTTVSPVFKRKSQKYTCLWLEGRLSLKCLQTLHNTKPENSMHSERNDHTPLRKNENSRQLENTFVTSHGALLPDTSHSNSFQHNQPQNI